MTTTRRKKRSDGWPSVTQSVREGLKGIAKVKDITQTMREFDALQCEGQRRLQKSRANGPAMYADMARHSDIFC